MPLGNIKKSVEKGLEHLAEAGRDAAKAMNRELNYVTPAPEDDGLSPAKGEDLATFNDSLKSQGYSREQRRRLLSINRKRSKRR